MKEIVKLQQHMNVRHIPIAFYFTCICYSVITKLKVSQQQFVVTVKYVGTNMLSVRFRKTRFQLREIKQARRVQQFRMKKNYPQDSVLDLSRVASLHILRAIIHTRQIGS